jgi:hypothetical protein
MKICSKCKIEKEETEFWVRKNRKSGVNSECKNCASIRRKSLDKSKNNEKRRKWYKNNKEKHLEYCKNYQKNNKEIVNQRHRKWWSENGEKYLEKRQNYYANLPEEKKEKIRKRALLNRKTYIEKNLYKEKARAAVSYALKNKWIIKPTTCSKCNMEKKIEAHHSDYAKAFDIIWVCKKCHVAIHKEMRCKTALQENENGNKNVS